MATARFDYEEAVQRNEGRARAQPWLYRAWLAAFTVLGYVHLPVLVGSLLCGLLAWVLVMVLRGETDTEALTVGVVAGSVAIPIIAGKPMRRIIRTMVASRIPQGGLTLRREEAPRLFEALEEARAEAGAPEIARVELRSGMSEGVALVARRGLLGGWDAHMTVGLALMHTMSPGEFRERMAWLLRELRLPASRFGLWAQHMSEMWGRYLALVRAWEDNSWSLLRFYEWYVPRCAAATRGLARGEARTREAEATEDLGGYEPAQWLAGRHTYTQFVDDHFGSLWKRAEEEPEPPRDAVTKMGDRLRAGLRYEERERLLSDALKEEPEADSLRPPLRERLAALGFAPEEVEGKLLLPPHLPLPEAPATSAAQVFLGDDAARLEARLDEAWWLWVLRAWTDRHEATAGARAKIAAMDGATDAEDTAERRNMRAMLTMSAEGDEAAMPLLERVLELDENHVRANYLLGMAKLRAKDYDGLRLLNVVMVRDAYLSLEACGLAHEFLMREEKPEDAEKYRVWADGQREFLGRVDSERGRVPSAMQLRAHDLSEEVVSALSEQVAGVEGVAEAYLVRRDTELLPEKPCYLIGIVPVRRLRDGDLAALCSRVANRLRAESDIRVVALVGENDWLAMPFRARAGAPIYTRSGRPK